MAPKVRHDVIDLTKEDDVVPPDRQNYKADGFVRNVPLETALKDKTKKPDARVIVSDANVVTGKRKKTSPKTDASLLKNECRDDFEEEDYEQLQAEDDELKLEQEDSEDEGDPDYEPDEDEMDDEDEGDEEMNFEDSENDDEADADPLLDDATVEEEEEGDDEVDPEEAEGLNDSQWSWNTKFALRHLVPEHFPDH